MDKKLAGTFLIKNPKDVNTLEMVDEIKKVHNKRMYNSYLAGLLIKNIGNNFTITRKIFSNLFYKDEDSNIENFVFDKISFKQSIAKTERPLK